ncbi:hypothetical protein TNIN_77151 [Trichonephila inaurata madagascariensis]|uniref:Uncharacterized protein n=1 Tax=Trichonephila inaurata madagascariensis TaxID=2747483 RepID=A0A8X6Y9G5_9ARAC|nr:hypothetical protein TNIN_77151 [Trichonephila inaurata madagascariensis]
MGADNCMLFSRHEVVEKQHTAPHSKFRLERTFRSNNLPTSHSLLPALNPCSLGKSNFRNGSFDPREDGFQFLKWEMKSHITQWNFNNRNCLVGAVMERERSTNQPQKYFINKFRKHYNKSKLSYELIT